jgi:CheY-like chemotaxis protein
MSRILLADDSPHAQRMGERILREEGFEVVTVTDGQTALMRLADVDPDLVLADVSLPKRSGYEICREIKARPALRHLRVVLTAGLLERFDETEAISVHCDAVLKKPFEASVMLSTIRPLVAAAQSERTGNGAGSAESPALDFDLEEVPKEDADTEQVRAAVTLALDAAMPSLVEELTKQVLVSLRR